MKKIIGVIGNPPLNKELLKHIDKENIVVNNHEIKDAMRKDYLQLSQEFIEYKANSKFEDCKTFDKPKSKFHK